MTRRILCRVVDKHALPRGETMQGQRFALEMHCPERDVRFMVGCDASDFAKYQIGEEAQMPEAELNALTGIDDATAIEYPRGVHPFAGKRPRRRERSR